MRASDFLKLIGRIWGSVKSDRSVFSKLPAEGAARGRRLVDADLEETGQLGFDFFPEPGTHFLDGRAFEAFDVIKIAVVEQFE